MKFLITNAGSFCFGLWLMLSYATGAQNSARMTTTPVPTGREAVALMHWRVAGKEGHLICEVSQATSVGIAPARLLTIRREDGGKLTEVFTFETPDAILNIYPLGDYDSRLFTTWIGGSAYHVRVFAFVDGRVKEVLEEGTKIAPEFLYDEQGRESVLITAPVMENGKWTSVNGTTTVFKWNGHSYDKLGTVPWAKRLGCLSKESCVSSK